MFCVYVALHSLVYVTLVIHFSGPGGAVCPVCVSVCPDNNFQTERHLTEILGTLVHIDTVWVNSSKVKFTEQGSRQQDENFPFTSVDAIDLLQSESKGGENQFKNACGNDTLLISVRRDGGMPSSECCCCS